MKTSKRVCNDEKQKTNKRMIYSAAGSVLLVTALVLYFIDPVSMIVRYKVRISKGSLFYEVLQQPELPGAYLETYVFNITNVNEFLSGMDSKLRVEEIGPFTYQEYRTNDDFELDEELSVMRYSPKIIARFVPEKSIAHPRDVKLTVPNIAMLAVASLVSKSSYFTRIGFNLLAKQLNSKPILNIDAEKFLWGFEEPLIKFGHTVMPGVITFDKMGILDRLYDPGNFRLEINSTQAGKFMINKYNGEPGLVALGYATTPSRCNTFEDTYEGIVYPTDLTKETPLRLYRNIFCRIIDLQYNGTKALEYGPAFIYKFPDNTFSNNTDNACLCKNDDCINGATDLSPCFFGLKLLLSNAHFLHADPAIYERIEGMNPREELHGSEFHVDPKLGTVLTTRFTLQLSVDVADVSFNPASRPFSDIIVPASFFKIIQPELKDDVKRNMWLVHVLLPNLMHSVEAIFVVISLVLLTVVVKSFLLYGKSKVELIEKKQVEPLFNPKIHK